MAPPNDPTAGAGRRLAKFCGKIGLALLVGAAGATAYIKYNPDRRTLERETREKYAAEAEERIGAIREEYAAKEKSLTERTEAKEKELDESFGKRKQELETKYCGSLDDLLTSSAAPTLSPLDRELYVLSAFGPKVDNVFDSGKPVYRQTAKSVNITATAVEARNGHFNNEYLVVMRRSTADNGLLSAHLYLGNATSATPRITVIFGKDDATIIDHEEKGVKRMIGSQTAYRAEGDAVTPYDEYAQKIYKQFRTLHQRGPFVEAVEKAP